MSFNKYNTRKSGGSRKNTPGRFVTAGQLAGPPQVKTFNIQEEQQQQSIQFNNVVGQAQPYNNGDYSEQQDQPFEDQSGNMDTSENDEQNMDESSEDPSSQRPHWMKPKLQGVRKISNKERRRRQNGTLRRLLTPKNALMVLNEIDKGDINYVVEPVNQGGQFFQQSGTSSFCAVLTSGGKSYEGYGDNKMAARNAAAEQAVRDLLIKKMNTILNNDNQGSEQTEAEEDLPMIQLASFALHKLFTEWECQGKRVPQLRGGPQVSDNASDAGSTTSLPGPKPPKNPRTEVPAAAATMHPCMLLSHMRPGLTYREVAVEGDKPLNIIFTMEVEVDGKVFTGKACNKREARKAAARRACQAIFGVDFTE